MSVFWLPCRGLLRGTSGPNHMHPRGKILLVLSIVFGLACLYLMLMDKTRFEDKTSGWFCKPPGELDYGSTMSSANSRRNTSVRPESTNDSPTLRALRHKSRVLCWVSAMPEWLQTRVKAINETWLPRCDGHVFFMQGGPKDAKDIVNLGIAEGPKSLTRKVVEAVKYLYEHELDKYDWFVKADADTYFIMENLRFLLSHYDANSPVHLGHVFKVRVQHGFTSGGAGIVLSRAALKKVVEDGYKQDKCPTSGEQDDLDLGRCLDLVGIHPHNSVDKYGRATFHPLSAEDHIARASPVKWLVNYDWFPPVSGRNCCSELLITLHHASPEAICIMDHLLYRTTVYGRVSDPSQFEGLFQPKPLS